VNLINYNYASLATITSDYFVDKFKEITKGSLFVDETRTPDVFKIETDEVANTTAVYVVYSEVGHVLVYDRSTGSFVHKTINKSELGVIKKLSSLME
jgi:vacuolar-type H+-ATPase subunit B/Vma2